MTDTASDNPLPVAEFYDWLAADYDRMTGFEKRFAHERPFFHLLVSRHGIKSAVDAGSGTGFHSLLLAQLGVTVTAVDLSTAMLEILATHAREMHLPVTTLMSSFSDLSRKLGPTHDAVVCMGNSLAHLLSADELRLALMNFAAVLRPGGILFLQNLHYDRVLARRERIQSVREFEGEMYIRFYDYERERIRFNVLRIVRQNGGFVHHLESVLLRPVLKKELLDLLADVGFGEIRCYGGVTLEEFDPVASKDLVVLAVKGSGPDGHTVSR